MIELLIALCASGASLVGAREVIMRRKNRNEAALKGVQERFERAGYRTFIGIEAPRIKNASAVYLMPLELFYHSFCQYCDKWMIHINQVFVAKSTMSARIAKVGSCCSSCGFFKKEKTSNDPCAPLARLLEDECNLFDTLDAMADIVCTPEQLREIEADLLNRLSRVRLQFLEAAAANGTLVDGPHRARLSAESES